MDVFTDFKDKFLMKKRKSQNNICRITQTMLNKQQVELYGGAENLTIFDDQKQQFYMIPPNI